MKQQTFITIALAAAASAYGQTSKSANAVFQYINIGPGSPGKVIGFEGFSSAPVTGKPFSAIEERHSLQLLGDGTRIENSDTNKIFRDAQGRTRIERPDGNITIQDPVEGTMAELNANDKTVRRMSFRVSFTKSGPGAPPEAPALDKMKAEMVQKKMDIQIMEGQKPGPSTAMVFERRVGPPMLSTQSLAVKPPNAQEESLGVQFLNGVNADGHRTVIRIPAGEVGNDRAMQVVSERWYSNDLQMVVKTSNSDPRFGDTTYQLTGIVQGAQDASLFQIPFDYAERR